LLVARPGRGRADSTARLPVVAATIGAVPDLDQRVAEREAQLDVERGVKGLPVGEDGPEAGRGVPFAVVMMAVVVMIVAHA
jgi:hypothetical protein